MDKSFTKQKGVFIAKVHENRRIKGRFYRIALEFTGAGAKAFAGTKPGQFAQLDVSNVSLPAAIPENISDAAQRKIMLRRPFSFCNVIAEDDKTLVSILYFVVGPASLRMTTLSPGQSISVIGPLGNGFAAPVNKKEAVLVLGGTGAGPIIHLAKKLAADCPGLEITAIVGARTAELLPFEDPHEKIGVEPGPWLSEFAKCGAKSFVTTDDGSAASRGLVTDCLEKWLDRPAAAAKGEMIIYACGPTAMLAKVAEIANSRDIECHLSLERMMACGIGLCQGCAVECKVAGSSATIYKLCCKDGPVFDSREIVF